MITVSAGKVKTFSATKVEEVNGKTAITYSYDDKTAFFSWDDQAKIGETNTDVYWSVISGEEVSNFDCAENNCGFVESIYIRVLKFFIDIYDAFGWKTQFIFFSWDETQPESVYWDPRIGTEDSVKLASKRIIASFLVVGTLLLL
eukprot:TRINITY_DN960_c0_g1_i1.p1 TRINITY_DN960_c0_g1~~TRINITY_DN960_c0_g1_i1.p1  ORF type:complete len:145 (+),score=37.20 TRINITY_DN960_c0_g1_i1:950-1384(+)